jgi:hypothetical protein
MNNFNHSIHNIYVLKMSKPTINKKRCQCFIYLFLINKGLIFSDPRAHSFPKP